MQAVYFPEFYTAQETRGAVCGRRPFAVWFGMTASERCRTICGKERAADPSAAVNSMSWNNPSPDEAANAYYSSKSRYNNAASQRQAASRAAEHASAERSRARSEITSCQTDKLNFEKRIEDIRHIVQALDGSASGPLVASIGADIPTLIASLNTSMQESDSAYRGSIISPDITPAQFYEIMRSNPVGDDSLLSAALQKFRDEIVRLQQAIAELERKINALNALVSDLSTKIRNYEAAQADWSRVMQSSAYDMNHYRGYM